MTADSNAEKTNGIDANKIETSSGSFHRVNIDPFH